MLQAYGVGEVPISISGDPADGGVLQHTIRDVGSVSHALATAEPVRRLGVRGPFGVGWEVGTGRGGDVVIVAGGIGLAPLRPAVLEICADRAAYGEVTLLYGARTPAERAVRRRAATLGGRARRRRARHRRPRRRRRGGDGSGW